MDAVNDYFKKLLPPFLKAWSTVMKEFSITQFHKKQVYISKGKAPEREVKLEISIKGDLEAHVYFDLPRSGVSKVIDLLIKRLKAKEENFEANANAIITLLSEVAENLGEKTLNYLKSSGLNCSLAGVDVIFGPIHLIKENTRVGVIQFASELGEINIFMIIPTEASQDSAKPVSFKGGLLLYNAPDSIQNLIIESFIPLGINVFSTSDKNKILDIMAKEKIILLLMNPNFKEDIKLILDKCVIQDQEIKILSYSSQKEWNSDLKKTFSENLLGYIPRSYDLNQTIYALNVILENLGFNPRCQKRQHIRVPISSEDRAMVILIQNPYNKDDAIHSRIEDLSIAGALLKLEADDIPKIKENQMIPLCQINLKGYVIRTQAKIIRKSEDKIAVQFLDIDDISVKKMAVFIHGKINSLFHH